MNHNVRKGSVLIGGVEIESNYSGTYFDGCEIKCHMNKVENELEYIKGTKVYKTLLERKVDKVLGENE